MRQATNLIDRALDSERAKPGWLLPYFRFAKALAEYRAGRLESALTLLDADTQQVLGPAPRMLLAMVQHRLGKADAARAALRGGRRLRLGREEGDGPRSLDDRPVAARSRNRAGFQAVADPEPSRIGWAGHCFARVVRRNRRMVGRRPLRLRRSRNFPDANIAGYSARQFTGALRAN